MGNVNVNIDECMTLLRATHWSVLREHSSLRDDRVVWMIICTRGEERIVVEGDTPGEVWQKAVQKSEAQHSERDALAVQR